MTKPLENSINSEKASEILRIGNFQISIPLCIGLGFETQLCNWAIAEVLGFLGTSGKIS